MASGNEVYRAGLGPTFLERIMLLTEGQAPGLSECVAVTDDDAAAAPVANCYWIRESAGSGSTIFDVRRDDPNFVAKDYEWPVCAAHRIEAVLDVLDDEENVMQFTVAGGNGNLLYDPLGAGTFRYKFQKQGGAFAYGAIRNVSTNYAHRWQFDGATAKFWVDGVLDVSIAFAGQPTEMYHAGTGLPANTEQYWCGLAWRGSDDIADRPNMTLTAEGLNPSSDNESADYGDQGDCTDARGDWQDWDDDGADDSNLAISLCELGGSNGIETSHVDNLTMASPKLVVLRQLGWASDATKVVATYARTVDGTPNVSEEAHANVGTTSPRGYSRPFPLAPDGGAWTQAKVNDLRAGIRTIDTNQTNDNWAMNRVEVFHLGDDPPSRLIERLPLRGVQRGVLRGV